MLQLSCVFPVVFLHALFFDFRLEAREREREEEEKVESEKKKNCFFPSYFEKKKKAAAHFSSLFFSRDAGSLSSFKSTMARLPTSLLLACLLLVASSPLGKVRV